MQLYEFEDASRDLGQIDGSELSGLMNFRDRF